MSVPSVSKFQIPSSFNRELVPCMRWDKISNHLVWLRDHYFDSQIEQRKRVVYLLAATFFAGGTGYVLGLPLIPLGVAVTSFSVTLLVTNFHLFKNMMVSREKFEIRNLNDKLMYKLVGEKYLERYFKSLPLSVMSFSSYKRGNSGGFIQFLAKFFVEDEAQLPFGYGIKAPFENSRRHVLRILKREIDSNVLIRFPGLREKVNKLLLALYSFSEAGGTVKSSFRVDEPVYWVSKGETFVVLPDLDFDLDENNGEIRKKIEFDLDPKNDPEYKTILEKISQLKESEGLLSEQSRDFLDRLAREYLDLKDKLVEEEFLKLINLLIENRRFLEPLITTCQEDFSWGSFKARIEDSRIGNELLDLVFRKNLKKVLIKILPPVHQDSPTH